MDVKKIQIETTFALANNEEKLKNLYTSYSRAFPKYAEFWHNMSGEEQGHANIIRGWLDRVDNDKILFDNSRFADGSISAYGKMIDGYTKELSNVISAFRAINVTVQLEESLIENKFFDGWKSDDAVFIKSLSLMHDAIYKHLEQAKRMRSIINNKQDGE